MLPLLATTAGLPTSGVCTPVAERSSISHFAELPRPGDGWLGVGTAVRLKSSSAPESELVPVATNPSQAEDVIVKLQSKGMSQRMIALALGISRGPIKHQLERHERKLSAR